MVTNNEFWSKTMTFHEKQRFFVKTSGKPEDAKEIGIKVGKKLIMQAGTAYKKK